MSIWKISAPASAGGFSKEAHVGHLVMFIDPEAEETPRFSGEGTQTAARCAYVICETCGMVMADTMVYGDVLVPRIIGAGEVVGGRLALGKARAGRSAPYLLEDPTVDDHHAMERFLDKYAVRMKSGKIVVETPATAVDEPDVF